MINPAIEMVQRAGNLVPSKLRDTAFLRAFAWWKIPLLAWVRPVVEELDSERCVVRIRLRRRTRNHLGSMYFGALCAGADVAGGLIAMREIQAKGGRASLVFKDFQAEFLSRPESDVYFTCSEGAHLRDMAARALASAARLTEPVHVTASVREKGGERTVARFTLGLSIKRQRGAK